ncbi:MULTISPECIES: hypothetical protein [Bacillus]|jgi:hypothetical protein|uniref:Uncharacterized protein n=3 Tax=Bacillus TaxID=1386 RepID=A0A1K2DF11_BACAB|nr:MULTISPECIES: hypothetical protein [Bacillus]MDH8710649.1 hypothetical protein [Micromonospora sp. 1209]MDN0041551.1 hypothetical protein [Bacillus aerophilus]WOQ71834.1 hypothetical protein R0126_14365 [Bacillus stratosphericus]CVM10284.1 Uncharacterised protein [Streptococcus pneumoniae]EDW20940.1 hypothetical protein BAT_2149 [Bacillus pumilus ATCC 7061]
MTIQKVIQYACSILGVVSLSFIYAQMFKKTKPSKKNNPTEN